MPSTQDSCAICRSRNFSLRRCHDLSWSTAVPFRLIARNPSPSSIKTAVDILQHGGLILIFPSGTRNEENIAFKRGAATVALHARVPLVPAFFQGPKQMQVAHLLHRPVIRVTFGSPIPTAELPIGKQTTIDLTRQLQAAIGELRSVADAKRSAA